VVLDSAHVPWCLGGNILYMGAESVFGNTELFLLVVRTWNLHLR